MSKIAKSLFDGSQFAQADLLNENSKSKEMTSSSTMVTCTMASSQNRSVPSSSLSSIPIIPSLPRPAASFRFSLPASPNLQKKEEKEKEELTSSQQQKRKEEDAVRHEHMIKEELDRVKQRNAEMEKELRMLRRENEQLKKEVQKLKSNELIMQEQIKALANIPASSSSHAITNHSTQREIKEFEKRKEMRRRKLVLKYIEIEEKDKEKEKNEIVKRLKVYGVEIRAEEIIKVSRAYSNNKVVILELITEEHVKKILQIKKKLIERKAPFKLEPMLTFKERKRLGLLSYYPQRQKHDNQRWVPKAKTLRQSSPISADTSRTIYPHLTTSLSLSSSSATTNIYSLTSSMSSSSHIHTSPISPSCTLDNREVKGNNNPTTVPMSLYDNILFPSSIPQRTSSPAFASALSAPSTSLNSTLSLSMSSPPVPSTYKTKPSPPNQL
jgi:hypothetical protein